LAILGGSFRLLAKAVLPLAVLFILAACGGGTHLRATQVSAVGISFEAPSGWNVVRSAVGVSVQGDGQTVQVSRFRLAKPYDPAKFDLLWRSTDTAAAQLAKQAKTTVSESSTVSIGGVQGRAYRYGDRRIGFVLQGTDEYQLYCTQVGAACDLLFKTFTIG
jgi:hypothetical protein